MNLVRLEGLAESTGQPGGDGKQAADDWESTCGGQSTTEARRGPRSGHPVGQAVSASGPELGHMDDDGVSEGHYP